MLAIYAPYFLNYAKGHFSECFPFVKMSKNYCKDIFYFSKTILL